MFKGFPTGEHDTYLAYEHISHCAARALDRSAYVKTSIFATSFAEATACQESYDVTCLRPTMAWQARRRDK